MINKENLSQLKLIVFDLDGTLLNDNGMVGNETQKLVGELKKHGVEFTLASGRLQCAITEYASLLELKTPLISMDGALIKSNFNGDTVFESFVPERYVKKAVKLADKLFLKVALCHDEAIFFTEYNSSIPNMLDKFGAEFREVESYEGLSKRVLEIVVAGEQNDSVKFLKSRMSFPYSFGINASYFKSHYHDGIYYSEIRKSGVSKGSGLERLLRRMKIKITESAVIGDWYNDRSLFETGAFKVAMANAVPEIKRMAQYVTKRNNNEDGVAEFLEMVLRAKKDKNGLRG
ncbi:MAG: Cof-type HAD-IIB family hydrolase [Ignavibacteria bacterium]|jgi:Cof subfamily protein (haloacid dehalogenase superfamily)|nr:Cof-type HAD-IIB family hydrolase [Ignavibacteria bacterium]MCU7502034.1 Cof-type HAD-IIB family hydrolase [Ignavibacteria bacterium]MCU7515436.1 Cof-type HAD-IIB family hydrolase [Ignavibacteria bacterium]